ncbi:gas vesicle protein GvpN [Natronobacterium gregoryi]|uniref:Gas vesicle protein GvpN n=2 Tax=Natronobacterium gregoryi TaxID=44930 RepID=L0AL94_NATGS|nr:gas vesicle protein GvpN [Natronobacterium gregoryi]AFZ74214.1 gas vesicle protein GvpN [Natronobacterium gregoryi SP2]ELY63669.1 gas vesicle protein GvpN [Natronobacterium gregoryi SP2]PLK21998.1 gas vesicle protein GvpN [Natronobacterium gregoryi SP2]SFI51614.1 gas vesicle protein GvpN [Natronobacterium gregoryi]
MADDASRKRTVRGRKIRSDRSRKESRKAKKALARKASSAGERNGDSPLSDPEEVVPEPFVETDAVQSLRGRITGWLEADQPVHLIGPTGCGKTALALSAAAERGRPVVWLNGDDAVDTAALVGDHAGGERYKEDDRFVGGVTKQTEIVRERWVDNPLSVAVREGATLVYNEFARSDPAAHNVLLSVFEEGVLERPGKRGGDRTVDVHPEFRAIVTSNDVEYAGVHTQQDALLDRFVGVQVDYYDEETEFEIVKAHVDLPDERIERVVDATRALRDELAVIVGTRAAITAAKGVAVFDGQDDDELLAAVFTDVLAPKIAGEGADDVDDLRAEIDESI